MHTFEKIISNILSVPIDQVRDTLTPHDIPDWDSMAYLTLIAELEKAYAITFTMQEVMDAKSVGDLHIIVSTRGHES